MIDTGDGQKIPLNYVAEIRSAMGPNTISRENVKRKSSSPPTWPTATCEV